MKIILYVSALFVLFCGEVRAQFISDDQRLDFSKVVLPSIPDSLTFAGEAVPVKNFDTRESLQRELLVACYMHSRTTITILSSTRFFPIIEPILKEYGVPDDFKYLCVAESGLNPNVVSPAKAAGLWQLMPATGDKYGLYHDSEVDLRYHVEKSTVAACKHLLESYERFKSWTMAAAAYNLGDYGVSKRLNVQGTTDYYDTFLPEETLRYIFRIVAAKLVLENPLKYGFVVSPSDYYHQLDDYTVVKASGANIDWSKFAKEHGTTYKMLRQLNHWIRDYHFVNRRGLVLDVKVPTEKFREQR